MKKTPPIGTRGIYQLHAPWFASPTKTYTTFAIRSFTDIYELGDDVYKKYYEPYGIEEIQFDKDAAEQANLITLISADNQIIYVPDTYIDGYPDMGVVNYQRVVVSIDFGMLPDYVDLSHVRQEMAIVATEVIGKTPTTEEHIAPTNGAVSPEEHQVLEASRFSNITYRDTSHAMYLKMRADNEDLIARNETLTKLLIKAKEEGIA